MFQSQLLGLFLEHFRIKVFDEFALLLLLHRGSGSDRNRGYKVLLGNSRVRFMRGT